VQRRGLSRLLRMLMKCEYRLARTALSFPPRAPGGGVWRQVDEPFSFLSRAKCRYRMVFSGFLGSLRRKECVYRTVSNRFDLEMPKASSLQAHISDYHHIELN
jgi:hypothetical protein